MSQHPSESTGQQQPQGEQSVFQKLFDERLPIDKQREISFEEYVNLNDCFVKQGEKIMHLSMRIKELESLSRWKSIAVDGLPGDGDPFTMFVVRTQDGSHFLSHRQEIERFIKWRANALTHWIELPNT